MRLRRCRIRDIIWYLCRTVWTKWSWQASERPNGQARKRIILIRLIPRTRKQKELAEEGHPSGTFVVADQQTAGKGRRGRSWDSLPGTGIYMTLMLKPDINPNHASMLTLVTAMAVANAMHRVTGAEALIKWPNDIVINGKKICGILTEMSAQFDYINHIVIGIGINVHNESFPEELQDHAGSLLLECGKHCAPCRSDRGISGRI